MFNTLRHSCYVLERNLRKAIRVKKTNAIYLKKMLYLIFGVYSTLLLNIRTSAHEKIFRSSRFQRIVKILTVVKDFERKTLFVVVSVISS